MSSDFEKHHQHLVDRLQRHKAECYLLHTEAERRAAADRRMVGILAAAFLLSFISIGLAILIHAT